VRSNPTTQQHSERLRESAAVLLVMLLPLLLALPQFTGLLRPDPLLVNADIATGVEKGVLAGQPFIDPNAGFQTQALGFRSAVDWLEGKVPWWNPFSGIGLPLAAEYQPASFFPLTLFMLLPSGTVWLDVVLQSACGLGTYLFLRRLALGRKAAITGGLVFAFNGTMAWFSHGPASVVPTLPWILYGIERARHASVSGERAGWVVVAAAMALSLLAGFPETAYINGLFCLMWACVRGAGLGSRELTRFAARVAIGGGVALLLSAPQLLSFFEYLALANVGPHADMSHAALPRLSAIGSLVAPYAFGPIFAYQMNFPFLQEYWGSIGGYVTILLLVTSAYGFVIKRDPLAWALVAWIVLALGKTFLVEPAVTLWNLVPGIDISAFARYAQPSWEFALVVLAAFALDRFDVTRAPAAHWFAALLGVSALAWSSIVLALHRHDLGSSRGLLNSAVGSMTWAAVTLALGLFWLRRSVHTQRFNGLAVLLVVDAALMSFIPTLSAPKDGKVDMPAVRFLKANLGLHRFFTLGPIAPNFGAYFGIASINHNYLPVSQRWWDEIRSSLQPRQDDPVVFNGGNRASFETARDNVSELERLGVRYVITPGLLSPYAADRSDIKLAYRDELLSIFELPSPAPYFETEPAGCTLSVRDREHVAADCASPAVLVRKELFFPGWTARVGSAAPAEVTSYQKLFQSVELPAGHSDIEFSYAPPHIDWAWGAMLAAAAIIATSAGMRSFSRRRMTPV
jgi:hypothetical protein